MASSNSIDTNPEALRGIASSVIAYTTCQYDIIRTYLNQMTAQENDIDLQSYRMCLEAIGEWLNRMNTLKSEGEQFAAFLNNKADTLDTFRGSR